MSNHALKLESQLVAPGFNAFHTYAHVGIEYLGMILLANKL